jgi:hypothetical protein
MLGSIDDKEICVFSISLARDLIQQAIACAGDDIDEPLDLDCPLETDIPTRMIESEPLPTQTFIPITIHPPLSQHATMESLEEIIDDQPSQIQPIPSVKVEIDIEIKTSTALSDKRPPPLECLQEQNMEALQPVDVNIETTISALFDKPDYSESSIFPFSLLGEAPEVILL